VSESSTTKTCRNCQSEVDPLHTGKCPDCGKDAGFDVGVSIIATMNISTSVSVSTGLYFELTDAVSVSGIKKNSSRFELVFEEDNPNMLKGFRINGINLDDSSQLIKAFQQLSFSILIHL